MAIDVMVDIETTGVSAGCGILSIGAVTFDENFKFYEKIDIRSCHYWGLRDLPDTIEWWSRQADAARMEAFSGTEDLLMVLGGFSDWVQSIRACHGDVFIWGNGADFDLPILGAAYEAVGIPKPWRPFHGRCYRTIKSLPKNKLIMADPIEGIKHNALADAVFQARHMMKILRSESPRES